MALNPGSRVGAYEVRSALGEGAMGVVFRAHDTRLQRDVAIKVLPEHFAADPDRLARFEREAKVLASLNHPNIAQIYGLEQSRDSICIVMELVDGETLAERIRRGPVPFDEALEIAKQIAEALEAAHDRGIVHRDLKPANIKRTLDGTVKVLDFGLAKAQGGDPPSVDASSAPTMDTGSMAGTIVGSPGYMAPEQARGRMVDKRADIWAFGCVLYELLTGKRAFDGEDLSEALGATIHKEPAWDGVPRQALPLLRRCLEKDPRRRLRDIGDAIPLFEQTSATVPANPAAAASKPWVSWIAVAAALLFASLFGISFLRPTPTPPDAVAFPIPPPAKAYFEPYISMSPDGRRIVFAATSEKKTRLWIRDLDEVESRVLPGTEGASSPFWSSDNKFIAFSVGNKLFKIDPAGGPPQTLTTSDNTIGTGSWASEDVVLFGHRTTGPLLKVTGAGGVPSPVTHLDKERGEISHAFPSFLADGRQFIYLVNGSRPETTGIYLGSLDKKPEEQARTRLIETVSRALFVPSADGSGGQILFLRGSSLMAQAFDNSSLSLQGEPRLVAERIETANTVYGVFTASANGALAYRAIGPALNFPTWVDRSGKQTTDVISTPLLGLRYPALSPDGKRLAIVASGALWVYDFEGRPPLRLTSEGSPASPIWTRDGQRIIYEANTPELERVLVSIPADGSVTRPEPISPMGHLHPLAWTPDGKQLIAVRLTTSGTTTNGDIVKFGLSTSSAMDAILETPANEGALGAAISPDGRWFAYTSDTTGNTEIWVKPYGAEGPPVRVSPKGGVDPLWSKDGRELFYRIGATTIMSVAVDTRRGFDFKPAVPLFESGLYMPSGQAPSYAIGPDGRFLMIRPADTAPSPITVVLNWKQKK